MQKDTILIAGAGPVGLAAALFLSRTGVRPRVIDKLDSPSPFSKAFGVNPRTLSLLESTGATEIFLKNGRKMPAINVYRNDRLLIRNRFSTVAHPYPFLLIQSQADSEAILSELLLKAGISVERGIELTTVSTDADGVTAQLKHPGGRVESFTADYIFAADGAHSSVRKGLGLDFEGDTYEEKWLLYDVELEVSVDQDEGHALILDEGGLFMVRIQGDIWRVIGNLPDLLNHLPRGCRVGQTHWQSNFGVSHRVTERLNVGRIYLGGDAAHIHAALGARGMNLGIEDAYVFAKLYASAQLDQYHQRRNKVVKDTIKRIHGLTDVMRGKTRFSKVFRAVAPVVLPAVFPLIKSDIREFVLGLDHEV